jgi:hypothetical protein
MKVQFFPAFKAPIVVFRKYGPILLPGGTFSNPQQFEEFLKVNDYVLVKFRNPHGTLIFNIKPDGLSYSNPAASFLEILNLVAALVALTIGGLLLLPVVGMRILDIVSVITGITLAVFTGNLVLNAIFFRKGYQIRMVFIKKNKRNWLSYWFNKYLKPSIVVFTTG